jgi:GMP synthase (glutamine-hydrolysing)
MDRAAKTLLVLQHIACEPPGVYEDELAAWGAGLHRVEVDEGEPIPDWRRFDGLIVMGGPMGAYQEDELPWLASEKRILADAARSGAPIWGVCLGAQLLAASLGANVVPGGDAEVGVLTVRCTPAARADPVFSRLPPEFKALQWHSDTYDLPPGAVQLARSDAYEQQAFVAGRAYALQFHLEVTSELAMLWGDVPAYARSLESIMGDGALPRLITEVREREPEMTGLARGLFAAWLERMVGLGRPLSGVRSPV